MIKLKENLINWFNKLKILIEQNTSISSLVINTIGIIVFIFIDKIFNTNGLLFETFRILLGVLVYFWILKIKFIFLQQSNVNEKGLNGERLINGYKDLKLTDKKTLTYTERIAILNNYISIENNKHNKIIKREQSDRIAISLIVIGMYVLGVI